MFSHLKSCNSTTIFLRVPLVVEDISGLINNTTRLYNGTQRNSALQILDS